ncbi:MAG: (2Fe-2S)-binding protein [Chloroflexia bacterium]|nr:(2Fe-2S)-binding protein [Chloroflexia bacterium]
MVLLQMTLNGEPVEIEIEPGDMLADVLRERLGLIGTKIGCGEGECGACTVLIDGESVMSCIYPAMKAQGRQVLTIEGLAPKGELHPVQQAFVEHFASQCGYCTPGFVMSTVALLDKHPQPTEEQILEDLSGNLCRCTGYYQIIEAVKSAAKKLQESA